jgi:hypothetical protein
MMEQKIFLDDVDFYQFAAVVEDEILNQRFPMPDGDKVNLELRRTLTETSHRLEIGIARSFVAPIVLDCRQISTTRLLVTARCQNDRYLPAFQKLVEEIHRYWVSPQQPSTPVAATGAPAAQLAPALATRPVAQPPPEPAKGSSPQPEPQRMNLGTARRVAEAKMFILTRGIGKIAACDLAGVALKTFNRWCDHPEVDELVEQLKEEQASS